MTVTPGEREAALVAEIANALKMPSLETVSPEENMIRDAMNDMILLMFRNTPANWARWEAVKAMLTAMDWMSRAHQMERRPVEEDTPIPPQNP